MTVFYVKTTGNDGLDGQSEANAWLTPGKAMTTATDDDTVYFAPGTYRISAKITCTNAGSAGHLITYEGDPDCVHFASENPGPVRITGCDANETPSLAADLILCAKDYCVFRNLVFDGTANGLWDGLQFSSARAGVLVDKCIVMASYEAVQYATVITNSLLVGGHAGCSASAAYNCVLMGMFGGYSSSLYGCLVIAGYQAAYYCDCYSCTFIGSTPNTSTTIDCVVVGAYGGGVNTGNAAGGLAIACSYPTYLTKRASNYGLYCQNAGDSGGSGDSSAQAKHVGYAALGKILDIARALKPDLPKLFGSAINDGWTVAGCETGSYDETYFPIGIYNTKQSYQRRTERGAPYGRYLFWNPTDSRWELATSLGGADVYYGNGSTLPAATWKLSADDSASNTALTAYTAWPTVDILGGELATVGGLRSTGAWGLSAVTIDYTNFETVAPGVTITGKGQEEFYVHAPGGTAITVTCQVAFTVTGAALPQLIMSGEGIATQTDTAVGDGTTFEELSVSATPDRDCELTVRVYQQDTTAADHAHFSDFAVS